MRSIMMMAALLLGSAALLAQSIPIKMGLWEKTIVNSNGEGAPSTMKARSCITPQEWQEMVAHLEHPKDGCKMNAVKTANGYNFNGTCTLAPGSSMAITGSETIQDSEHIVAESHSTTAMNGKTKKMDSHSTSRFVSSSCGSVKPGDPEIEDK